MTIYSGCGIRHEGAQAFERVIQRDLPKDYRADKALATAVNVAILLGQPLLVTGLPGTGKTQLAHSVAWELGLGERALQFNTKSSSTARELFYTYDALGRYQATFIPDAPKDPLSYIRYNALGQAILLANPRAHYAHLITPELEHPGPPRRSVVLIDEIDKAPRDFPNDLLDEIESMRFRIPEVRGEEVRAPAELRPIVIITSNSEKNLPDAFLRRCVYHHIAPPEREDLERIVANRVKDLVPDDSTGVADAITLFLRLRDDRSGLLKKPGTAELIGWIATLKKRNVDLRRRLSAGDIHDTLGVLVKLQDDLDAARKVVNTWPK